MFGKMIGRLVKELWYEQLMLTFQRFCLNLMICMENFEDC